MANDRSEQIQLADTSSTVHLDDDLLAHLSPPPGRVATDTGLKRHSIINELSCC
jgi:hypothetical protein